MANIFWKRRLFPTGSGQVRLNVVAISRNEEPQQEVADCGRDHGHRDHSGHVGLAPDCKFLRYRRYTQ